MPQNASAPHEWSLIADDLDAAVSDLPAQERDVLVLRFFAGKTHPEIATDLEISTEAASKRVQRALASLRTLLSARGIALTDVTLAAALGHALAGPAPPALAATVTHSAFTAASTTLLKGALMASVKVKAVAATAVVAALVVSVAVVTRYSSSTPFPAADPPSASPAAAITAVPEDPVAAFDRLYRLEPDQMVTYIPPPFPAARAVGFERVNTNGMRGRNADGDPTPRSMLLRWTTDDSLELRAATWGAPLTLRAMLAQSFQVPSEWIEGDSALIDQQLPGDLIVRQTPQGEQLCAGFEQVLSEQAGAKVTVAFRWVERPGFILRGNWKYTPLPELEGARWPQANDPALPRIEIYGGARQAGIGSMGSGITSGEQLAGMIGGWIRRPVFSEAEGLPEKIMWRYPGYDLRSAEAETAGRDPASVLNHITEQTGLRWSEETRKVPRLFVEYAK
jgi:hypothetical protein